jgi:imidazolonepropionase-like amidohydrolase
MKKNIVLFFTFLAITQIFAQQKTIIHCGKLIDGISDAPMTEMTLFLDGKIITEIRRGFAPVPENTTYFDLKNRTVLPGLMDMHVHIEFEQSRTSYSDRLTKNDAYLAFRAYQFGLKTLNAGFTTVRDLGGEGANIGLRDAINDGLVQGPRIFTAGKTICITGGHGDPSNGTKETIWASPGMNDGVADNPDACRKEVRNQIKRGADCIKITATGGVLSLARDGLRPSFSLEEIQAVIAAANDAGVTVAAHAHGDEGMRRAIEAGVTSIEHGSFMSETTMDLMIKKGVWYVPTLLAARSVSDSAKSRGFFPPMVAKKALEVCPQIQITFGKAYRKGVKIAFGTDSGVSPHGKNALEFQYLVEAGMTPMETIKAATVNAADLLRIRDRLGSLEKGKIADIIAVDGDPIIDITTLQRVKFVMKEGAVFKNEK